MHESHTLTGLSRGGNLITLMTLTKSKRSRFRFTTLGVVRLMHMRARARVCVGGEGGREPEGGREEEEGGRRGRKSPGRARMPRPRLGPRA